jgi:lysosomal acid lipase/cholesteryl ester hydrolase
LVHSGKLQFYDYGKIEEGILFEHSYLKQQKLGSDSENEKHYNQTTPPIYNLKNFPPSVNMSIFHGSEDYLADPADVAKMISVFGEDRFFYNQASNFDHMSYVWGLQAPKLVYSQILDMLNHP